MPTDSTVSPSDYDRRAGWLLALAAVLLAAWLHFTAVRAGLSAPVHSREEILTALRLRSLAADGPQLHPATPILGQPWKLPDTFSLYHNTAALVARTTGQPVESAGRWTSLLVFFLGLPALYLLARRLDADHGTALLAVALWLGSASGREHATALTANTTALTLALWWLWLFLQNQFAPTLLWRLLVPLTGMLAAVSGPAAFLVFALAAGIFCPQVQTKRLSAAALTVRLLAGILPPLVALACWTWHTDLLKAANPYASFLHAGAQWSEALGSFASRLHADFWSDLVALFFTAVASPLALLLLVVFAGTWTTEDKGFLRRLLPMLGLTLAIFLPLYLRQPAETGAIILLSTLCFARLTNRVLPARSIGAWAAAGVALLAQCQLALPPTPIQRSAIPQIEELAAAVSTVTGPRDLVITSGQDWDLAFAHRLHRRCILIPIGRETDLSALDRAVGPTPDWPVGAVILTGRYRDEIAYVEALIRRFQLHPQPVLRTSASDLYVPAAGAETALAQLHQPAPTDPTPPPAPTAPVAPKPKVNSPVPDLTLQPAGESAAFSMMSPQPTRHAVPYDLTAHDIDGRPCFFAHAPTVLEFDLPAGATSLALDFFMPQGAYTGEGNSDGTEIVVLLRRPDGSTAELFRRTLDPATSFIDREHFRPRLTFTALPGSTLILQCLAGPENRANFDWVYFTNLVLK